MIQFKRNINFFFSKLFRIYKVILLKVFFFTYLHFVEFICVETSQNEWNLGLNLLQKKFHIVIKVQIIEMHIFIFRDLAIALKMQFNFRLEL